MKLNTIRLNIGCILFFTGIIYSCSSPNNGSSTSSDSATVASGETDLRSFIGKDYFIDDQHSYLGFKIKYFGFSPVRGRFDSFDGTLMYDPDNLGSLSVTIFVDVSSINTGNERRDNDLTREGSWFDAKTYPTMTFTSQKVVPKSDGGFDLIGEFTAKGVTMMDTISFEKPTALSEDFAKNQQVDFSGKITLNRQDFGIYGGDFWSSLMENGLTQLSDEVEIELDMHCRRANYQARYEDSEATEVNRLVLDRIRDDSFEMGMKLIDSLNSKGMISAGRLSSVGYTLNTWERYSEAKMVFSKRDQLFPERASTFNQLGITELFLENYPEARERFQKASEIDSSNSRSNEYLRLMDQMGK